MVILTLRSMAWPEALLILDRKTVLSELAKECTAGKTAPHLFLFPLWSTHPDCYPSSLWKAFRIMTRSCCRVRCKDRSYTNVLAKRLMGWVNCNGVLAVEQMGDQLVLRSEWLWSPNANRNDPRAKCLTHWAFFSLYFLCWKAEKLKIKGYEKMIDIYPIKLHRDHLTWTLVITCWSPPELLLFELHTSI